MNKLLPDFYKCCFKVSLNAKDFVLRFHAEEKRQYNAEQTFIELRDTLDNSINVKDLSSISKYYDPEYSLGPFDIGTIKHNKDRIKQLYQKGKKLEEELIECSNLFTNKSGKIKPGKDVGVNFNSSLLSKLMQLKSDLKECFNFLKEKYDTCSSLFEVRNSEKLSGPKGKGSRTGKRQKNQSLIVTLQTKKEF